MQGLAFYAVLGVSNGDGAWRVLVTIVELIDPAVDEDGREHDGVRRARPDAVGERVAPLHHVLRRVLVPGAYTPPLFGST